MQQNKHFDTIILGAGLAGTTLASILAKQGFSVLLIEKETHPRFAIGESMGPLTSMWIWINSERFDVPELKNLISVKAIREHVSSGCGIKRTLGFLYHNEGETQNPNQSHLFITPPSTISESHLFRPDVDHYMLKVAISYGVEYRDLTEVQQIDFQEDSVQIRTKNGEEYTARFLVDGSGYRSLVAEKLNLREKPTRLRNNSRSIFTHVTNLRPYDECVSEKDLPELSCRWHDGTLHHVFDGGWMWVIPFDNHKLSESSLCSIGLMLDGYKFPEKDMNPEQEFQTIVNRFPSIAEHLKGIKPVRKWISTDRIQYSSTNAVGHRYTLLSHSYAFIDPIYSRGLISTFETVHSLAGRLIQALKDDDFSIERFAYVNKLLAARIDFNDRLIYNTFRAMSHFSLWNAVTQLWLANLVLDDIYLFRNCIRCMSSGNLSFLAELEEEKFYPETGIPSSEGFRTPFAKSFKALVDGFEVLLDKVETRELLTEEAANQMLTLLKQSEILPKSIYPWGTPVAQHLDVGANLPLIQELIFAGQEDAPVALLEKLFNVQAPTLIAV